MKIAELFKHNLIEGVSEDSLLGLTKTQVTTKMKAAGYPREKIPGGEGSHEAAYRSKSGFDWYFATFASNKLIRLQRRAR